MKPIKKEPQRVWKEEKRIKRRLLEQYQEFAEDDIKKRHVAGVGLNGRF